ncbi:hypothetical protein EDEG_01784 [Edhazardia aedis USNM 41457]|uniref:mRNA-capping enzyme subunit beta n=1 Tax=Edhazardia aedis (strain USNM 41457) TaxID=1003232 RepID=J8ZW62_EDHAE|nr:hypothetical protein EDEG_01784 [Edhazardia aedis USNM 41457]|eukprot:EJW03928.1 hypothetical protein EDEG_01784 [Edhazardia aedis USNM 41457]
MSVIYDIFKDDSVKELEDYFMEFLNLKKKENIEIELRVGQIINTITNKRIEIPTNHPVFFCLNNNIRKYQNMEFRSGVDQKIFNSIFNKIDQGKNRYKLIETTVYSHAQGRYIYDDKGLIECHRKERLSHIEIYFPNKLYDVRISISQEIPIPFKKLTAEQRKLTHERRHKRKRIEMDGFYFDFTIINQNRPDMCYEIEVECKNLDFDKNLFMQIVYGIS